MRRVHCIVVVLAFVFASTALLAQSEGDAPKTPEMEMPHPAPQLDKFKVMIGNWEGTGTAVTPGGSTTPWTSKSTWKWILNGYFLQEDLRVDFQEGGMPFTMVMRSFYGWDAQAKRYVAYEINNYGELNVEDQVNWVNDSTLVLASAKTKNGQPELKRTVMVFENSEQTSVNPGSVDTCKFRMQTALGADDFAITVEGTLKRTDQPYAISDAELNAPFMPMPVSPAMQKIHRISGEYTMQGEWIMMPGSPAMKISGTETIRPIFGGQMLLMHVIGDPAEGSPYVYEHIGFLSYNAESDCYRQVHLSNMGESSCCQLRWLGDNKLVSVISMLQYGQPVAARSLLELSETGAIQKVSMDSLTSGYKVERAFIGNYKKMDDAKSANPIAK